MMFTSNDYVPPYSITNQMVASIASISDKIGRISVTNDLENKPHLRRSNRIRSIHSSLKIEANSLSIGEVKAVIDGKTVLGQKDDIQEVKNAYAAYEQIANINPYDLDQLKQLHGVMTQYLINESGTFRRGNVGVFDGERCIFTAPPPDLVPHHMENLFQWMQRSKDIVHPLILSSVFHYEFLFIHPFADGNGRMARLWHTALLTQWKSIFQYIPLESQIEKFQSEYYAVIDSCNHVGDSTKFIEFMLLQIDKVLAESMTQSETNTEQLSEEIVSLLNVMDHDTPYTRQTLMAYLGLSSTANFRKKYLEPAMQLNLIRMTIPDKPTSRNQRYIKTSF